MKFSIIKLVPEVLNSRLEKRLTAREIATIIMQDYPDAVADKRANSTAVKVTLDSDDAMLQQIVAEIGAQRQRIQKKVPQIKTTEGRPRKYYYTMMSDLAEVDADIQEPEISVQPKAPDASMQLSESDLYPFCHNICVRN